MVEERLSDQAEVGLVSAASQQHYEALKEQFGTHQRLRAEFAQATLRGLTLINGGAVVALFTLLGQPRVSAGSSAISLAFGLFATGLAFTLVASMASFFAQNSRLRSVEIRMQEALRAIQDGRPNRGDTRSRGTIPEKAGVAAAILSLIMFLTGAWMALTSINFR